MKTVFGCVLLALVMSLKASAGGMVGNGGDGILQEFNLRGLQLDGFFKVEARVAQTYGIDPDRFLEIVKKTKLEAQDHLFLNGVEVDAVNYPAEFRIQVSRTRWAASAARADSYLVQRRIALHEYLWVYGIRDEGYVVSNPIIQEIEKATQAINPAIQTLIQQNFCDKLVSPQFDWVGAKNLLSWGLDVNAECPNSAGLPNVRLPILRILESTKFGVSQQQIDLVEAMLKFGLNPNQEIPSCCGRTVALVVGAPNLDFKRILFAYGADPNSFDKYGQTAFARAAEGKTISTGPDSSDYYPMQVAELDLFLAAGGDLNLSDLSEYQSLSPAQVIVDHGQNRELVLALIKTGKVDWCSGEKGRRTIDRAYYYKDFLAENGVMCEGK